MAISRIPNKYKGFTFDGVDSKDFGVYISDTAAFDAPERDVEMIEIPGRNGAYALDKGRFSNIEVTYNAFVATDSESDYVSGINALRNALCSRKGYCRLEDEFNPNEYRLAVYKSGLKVSSVNDKAGEFTITFDCQPQRWLKSGETAVTLSEGGTLTNPTLFEAHPLLKVKGNGNVGINGSEVRVVVAPLGRVDVFDFADAAGLQSSYDFAGDVDPALYVQGDKIYVGAGILISYTASGTMRGRGVSNITCSDANASVDGWVTDNSSTKVGMYAFANGIEFEAGTAGSATVSATLAFSVNGTQKSATPVLTVAYDGATGFTFTLAPGTPSGCDYRNTGTPFGPIWINSTVSTISDFLYIDLDIGEAYMYDANNKIISLNDRAEIPASLPALVAGANTITVDGAINELVVIPRWWEV